MKTLNGDENNENRTPKEIYMREINKKKCME